MSATRVSSAPVAALDINRPVAIALAALLLLAIWLYWPSIAALAKLWSHPERRTYQHGYLISAIVLWLLYRSRGRISAAAGPQAPALILAALLIGLCWAVAWQAGLRAVHVLLWPAALWCAAAGMLGVAAGRLMLWPFAYFYFGLPVWDALIPSLQAVTVYANQAMALLVGMPVVIDGTLIHIPAGSFEIAGGCSGLNYLVVGLAIAALLGEINRDSWRRRAYLIALGGMLALISNWLRVFIIIYAGHLSDMTHYLVRVDHYKWGWVLFAFVLVFFFAYTRRLPPSQEAPVLASSPARRPGSLQLAAAMAAVLALALGPLLTVLPGQLRAGRGSGSDATNLRGIGLNDIGSWKAGAAVGDWTPEYPGADAESLVEFLRGDDRITVYAAGYLTQSQGRELIGHDSRIQGRAVGRLARTGRQLAASSPPIQMAEAEWRGDYGGRALLWWTYQIDTQQFAAGLPAQLWYGIRSLWSRPVSAIVALHAECLPDCEQARRALKAFSAEAMPELLAAAVNVSD